MRHIPISQHAKFEGKRTICLGEKARANTHGHTHTHRETHTHKNFIYNRLSSMKKILHLSLHPSLCHGLLPVHVSSECSGVS